MRVRLESFGRGVAGVLVSLAALGGVVHAQSEGPFKSGSRAESPAARSDGTDTGVIDVTRRVIGGSEAAFGQFPSIVALLDAGLFSPADRQFCGGSVIDARWVLTAAHCVHDASGLTLDPATVRVVEQVLDLRAEAIDEEVVVTNIIVHPAYDHGSVETYNDIALLELATALDSPSAILFEQDPEPLTGEFVTIAGWGATEFSSPRFAVYPDALQHASVPLVSRAACNAPGSYDFIREGQLCAGFIEGGVDSCLGDSGGPLYTRVNGRTELIGVTSFGRGCAEPNFYGIYTSVASYLDWIGQFVTVRTLTRDAGEPSNPGTGDQTGQGGGTGLGGGADRDEIPSGRGDGGTGSAGWAVVLLLAGLAGLRRRDRRADISSSGTRS